jgi:hypothetical protein
VKKIIVVFMAALVIFQITGSVQGQMVLAEDNKKEHIMPAGIGASLLWIDKNLPKDSVFLTPEPETNYHLQLYTAGRVFIQYPYEDLISSQERSERLYIVYKFFEVSPETFVRRFEELDMGNLYGRISKSEGRDIISGYEDYKF